MTTALGRWLRHELPQRGYQLGRGGVAAFAEDTGLSASTASRTINGTYQPTLETLRKISGLFEIPLGEVLIIAELATPDELVTAIAAIPPADVNEGPQWEERPLAERFLWHTPETSPDARHILVRTREVLATSERAPGERRNGTAQSA